MIKKAFVWFWVRTSMPKRVWKKCMEFKMKNADGKLEKYFIDPTTGTAHKVYRENVKSEEILSLIQFSEINALLLGILFFSIQDILKRRCKYIVLL